MSVRRSEDKILGRGELVRRFGRPRKDVVVFTNGCFDLLHRGHVSYLAGARALGDRLVVGVNTDASVRRLEKGAGRPLVAEGDRALVLASLEAVDAVCLFDEDTPRALIAELLPDVLVKGADYELEQVAGGSDVVAAGGRVVLLPFVEGYSTSALIERIREAKP
jgi:rfaE bifunctional protein nucleotidyltransferase chain/domain